MKNQPFFVSRYLVLLLATVFLLTACGEKLESPEKVMAKAKEAITDVESGSLKMTADVDGKNGVDDMTFEGGMEMTFDSRDKENYKLDLHVALSGDLQAGEKKLNGDLDVDFVTVDKKYYLKLNNLESSDDSLTAMKPFIDLYKSKWLHIEDDFIPQDIRELQSEDEAAKLKKKQLENLFKETTLFDVVKEYGIEKLNGEKVYHYGVKPNMEGFKDYMVKAAVIDGRELTAQEVQEAVQVLSYIKSAELYIDADDYYVLKSVLLFTGQAISVETDANLEVEIVIEGSDYNKSVTVKAPEGAEDFNPLVLFMGLGGMPAMTEEDMEALEGAEVVDDGVVEDEVTEEVGTGEEVTE